MAQTYVDTFFFDGALSANEITTRVGRNAILVSSLVHEDASAAMQRLASFAEVGVGAFFTHFYSPLDRLQNLPVILWRNRDIQYVNDICEIRAAISRIVGEPEGALFLAPPRFLLSEYGQANEFKFFSFDCSLRNGAWGKDVLSLSNALDEQIAAFWSTRFVNAKIVRTMVLRSVMG